MKKDPKTQNENRLFVLHHKGRLLGTFRWENSDGAGLQGWRPPKKIYFKEGQANCGATHLPTEILDDIELVEYVPIRVIKRYSTKERREYLHKKEIESKQYQLEYAKKYHQDSIARHQKELDELLKKSV